MSGFLEKVAQFGTRRGLVGVLTVPTAPAKQQPHVIVLSTGILHRVGSNRLSVDLARALALNGATVLRFDLSGVGDSIRRTDVASIRQSVERDIGEAVDYLVSSHGAERVVLMGVCSGAFDALSASLSQQRVAGTLMVDLPGPFRGWRHTLHHLAARLFRPASWRSPFRKLWGHSRELVMDAVGRNKYRGSYIVGGRGAASREHMEMQLQTLLARGVRLQFIFTAGLEANYNHHSQFRTTFPQAAKNPALACVYYPDLDHTFASREARERVTRVAVEWMGSDWPPGDAAVRRTG